MQYEKPIVIINDDLAENIYATGSGSYGFPDNPNGISPTDCWVVTFKSVQDWNGSHHIFEIQASHNPVKHISAGVEYRILFSEVLNNAYSEFSSSINQCTLTVTRTLLGDAYHSGDLVTFKVWAAAGSEAATKAMTIVGISIKCDQQPNVHGEMDQ